MRPLALFLIGIVFGVAGGFLLAGGAQDMATSHDHMGHSDTAHDGHDLSALTEWPDDTTAPEVTLRLRPDMGSDMNLHIIADGFRFAPEEINGPVTPAAGHAHVYVNGTKVGRAYGPYYLLSDVPQGALIRVTLNANDHTNWGLNGQPLAGETIAPTGEE